MRLREWYATEKDYFFVFAELIETMTCQWRQGLKLTLWLFLLQLAIYFPARLPFARHEAEFGRSIPEVLLTTLAVDLRYGLMFFTLLVALVFLPVPPVQRFLKTPKVNFFAAGLASLLLLAGSLALTFTSIAASEFKLQRGIYPVKQDIFTGLTDAGFVGASLSMFTLDRYRWSLLLCLVLEIWLLRKILPYLFGKLRSWQGWATFLLSGALASAAAGNVYIYSEKFLPSIRENEIYQSPFKVFAESLNSVHPKDALKFFFKETPWDEKVAADGAALLGFPKMAAEQVYSHEQNPRCQDHPLKAPLLDESVPLMQKMAKLSRELFAEGLRDLQVVHFIAESFRTDDMAALNPMADEVVTPFMNSVLRKAVNHDPGVLAATAMQQGGVRTSQGIAGIMCGMGAVPLHGSVARDFGIVPLRCLPDVLQDSGFNLKVFYGADFTFDRMQDFFEFHNFDLFDSNRFPDGAATGVWGKSDLATWQAGWRELREAAKRGGPRYSVFLTLSNHFPFTPPSDLPTDLQERMARWQQALAAQNSARHKSLSADDFKRLVTMAYTDEVIRQAYEAVAASPAGDHSIIIISGDHSTMDPSPWRTAQGEPQRFWKTQVPFAILFPPALAARLKQNPAWQEVLSEIQQKMQQPLSLNDTPRLLMALFSHHPGVKSLPTGWRWHSMPGQVLSRDFSAPRQPETVLWGIDGSSQLFWLDANQEPLGANEEVSLHQAEVPAEWQKTSLYPAAVFFGSFLRGFAASCGRREVTSRSPLAISLGEEKPDTL